MKNIKINVNCVLYEKIEARNRLEVEDAIGYKDGCSPCIICGRPVKPEGDGLFKNMLGLFQTQKGDFITDEEEKEGWNGLDSNDFLGYYPCGSNCYKKYKKMAVEQELVF